MIDNQWQLCDQCGVGRYTETQFTDDVDGVLHCNQCGHQVDRYPDYVAPDRTPPGLRNVLVKCCGNCDHKSITGVYCRKFDYTIPALTMICDEHSQDD